MIYIIESVGIFASILIIASMSFKTQTRKGSIYMRIINALGSLLFVVYGVWLPTFSTALVNAILVIINIYHLILLIKRKEVVDVSDDISYTKTKDKED